MKVCEFDSRGQLSIAVELLTRKNRNKRLVIAMHHPLKSLGKYGGHFKAVEHFKPPIAGSVVVWSKQGGLIPQYRNHVKYDSMASSFEASADKSGSFIFVSGHDKSMQLLQLGKQLQIVSGTSGNKPTPVVRTRGNDFAKQASGWAELQLNTSHDDRVIFVDGKNGETLLSRELPKVTRVGTSDLPDPPPVASTPTKATYAKDKPRKTRFLKRILLGRHYRDAHRLELDFPTLNLTEEHGGLVPIRIGGGNQTNSLRLEDSNGGQWSMRSTTKDSSRFLPYPLNETFFVTLLIEDGYTASHPAAAVAIPKMAEAVGLFHTRPRLMYLPDQTGLQDIRGYITDEVVLLERRPKQPDNGNLPAHLGGDLPSTRPLKYISTSDMLAKMENEPWKHRANQEMMLRARLFDLFVGDWDRHEDQWRFVRATQEDGTKYYYPIPRDRDQAFANYDGALLAIARLSGPGIRVLKPFGDDIKRLTWLAYNARYIDPVLLNRLTRERWMEIAAEVQAALTDEVIASGMAQWPEAAYELDGKAIEKKLRSRRDQIVRAAGEFFDKINENVEILGSEHRDLIDVTFVDDNAVKVVIRRHKDGPSGTPYFERTFLSTYTDELRIYALSGRDKLVVHGKPHSAITIRFVGGAGDDLVTVGGEVESGLSVKSLKVYDRKKSMEIDSSIKVDKEFSKSTYRNHYQRTDVHHEPTTVAGSPGFLINADDGLYLGGSIAIKRTKFKRSPFASSHNIRAFLATSTFGVDLGYKGVFPETLGPLDQELSISGQTPNSTRNFFGLTNRYTGTGSMSREFFRLKQISADLNYGLVARLESTVRTGIRFDAQLIDTEDTAGRFVVLSPDAASNALGTKLFLGATAFVGVNTIDVAGYPKRGIAAGVSANFRSDATPSEGDRIGTSGTFTAAVATHIPLDRHQRFTLSSRARAAGIVGNFPFYFAPTLGDQDIRAYNAEQLAGNGVFAQTSDLRMEIIRIRTGLPGAIGIAGSIDHGLAFGPDTDANGTYHASIGGSLYWSILGVLGLSVGYHYGFEGGRRLAITFGPLFGATGVEN